MGTIYFYCAESISFKIIKSFVSDWCMFFNIFGFFVFPVLTRTEVGIIFTLNLITGGW